MSYRDCFGRDNRGRWRKGFCPNPNGRPRKKPAISDSDVGWFKQHVLEVMVNGEKRQLIRHELLLHSIYEQAIKGKSVNLARKLLDRFEDVDMTWAQARDTLKQDREAFLKNHHEGGKFDDKRARELIELEEMLSYGRKPKPRCKTRVRRKPGSASWRKGPKPQSLLDLEKEEEAEIRAEERERARKLGLPIEPEDDDDGPAEF